MPVCQLVFIFLATVLSFDEFRGESYVYVAGEETDLPHHTSYLFILPDTLPCPSIYNHIVLVVILECDKLLKLV